MADVDVNGGFVHFFCFWWIFWDGMGEFLALDHTYLDGPQWKINIQMVLTKIPI